MNKTRRYSVIISYDKNGGDTDACPVSNKIRTGGTVPILPLPPEKQGFKFIGWNFDLNGREKYFTDNTPVDADITVYAQWLSLAESKKSFFNSSSDWQIKGTKSKMADDWMYIADNFSDIPETLIRPYLDTFKNGLPPFAAVCPNIKGGFFKKENPLMICLDNADIYFISALNSAMHKLSEIDYFEQSTVLLRTEIIFHLNNGINYPVTCNRCNQNIIDFIMGKIRDTAAAQNPDTSYFHELEQKSYYLMNQGNQVLKNSGGLISYIYKAPKSKRDSDFLIILTETEIICLMNEKSAMPVSKKTTKYIPLGNLKSAERHSNLLILKTRNGNEITAKISSVDTRSVDEFIGACLQKIYR